MIEQSDFFKYASVESKEAFLHHSKKRTISEGDVLFRERQKAEHVFYVVSGAVSFTFHDEEGKSFIIGIAAANTFIGELEAFNEGPRISQAVALQESEVLAIRKEQFIEIFGKDTSALLYFVRYYAKELQFLMRFSLVMDVDKRSLSHWFIWQIASEKTHQTVFVLTLPFHKKHSQQWWVSQGKELTDF
ncbi:hypothetical protein CS022_05275 [Veronia nyctiphanis]|uniref:Cyclic nucleotide-binding domain-containing protein n=1 Tax=Veronia nyctiphanis TaxID=1278244 RepID=A0A4Q0YV23_9GAMM|nr:Crp/Fnr family transcriptional regulator [Veronia nyctiphanis]RXJ74054.1 hypothetical protein CS022_05275 [Veronia nyctiphanis]